LTGEAFKNYSGFSIAHREGIEPQKPELVVERGPG
jgi:hypothetical protein